MHIASQCPFDPPYNDAASAGQGSAETGTNQKWLERALQALSGLVMVGYQLCWIFNGAITMQHGRPFSCGVWSLLEDISVHCNTDYDGDALPSPSPAGRHGLP